ncbi:receptor-type tyrosine-protein phosphatase H [Episyrphus balteatus]|uniref:receptor-type tyrosine-protein phosphatase H n=1 Tax=Episyrphus balteatus TaxID=286459 RepID=UPI002486957E|nr:receptor-type tyrosine-protein phosphatase H [Episyrphus balteatus]XP_055854135.1 receptor-type tyrosine-protein phosphatase H [Episyrphus balteatus]XP_055854136.1 receptor-type tyrosine-protein phosphatase H [Episyrphus balteatus]XP_055854137.1 receptor-type tyrosine-protein phosphatase H [Episyrphus balteatus]
MLNNLKQWNALSLTVICIVLIFSKRNVAADPDPKYQIEYIASTNKLEFSVGNEDYILQGVVCKSIQNSFNGTKSCEGLDPCVTYIVTLYLTPADENDQSNGIDQTFDVNTTYAIPQVQNLTVRPGSVNLDINWDTTYRTCIAKFELSVKTPSTVFNSELQNDKDSFECKDLNPCQNHSVQLRTRNIYGDYVGDLLQQNVTTDFVEPEDVTDIKVIHVDNVAVKVTWESPKFSSCINILFLKWSTLECIEEFKTKGLFNHKDNKEDECKWKEKNITDANTKEVTIQDLDGCEEYGLFFYINEIPKAKSELKTFTSPEQLPGLIEYGKHKINSTAVTVVWKLPKQNKKCVDVYHVYMTGPIQKDPASQNIYPAITKETVTHFDNLDPCGEYNISVQPFGHNGFPGIKVNSSLVLEQDNPTQIRNVQVDAQAKEIHLNWDPPEFAELCLEGYRISAWTDITNSIFDKEINETQIVITDLVSCQVYTVQIIPFTKSKKRDGIPEHIEQITSPMVAAPPNPFQSTLIESHSIELSARVNDNDYSTNKCQTLFARFVCETGKNVPFTSVVKYVEGRLGDVSFKATMSPMSPFTEYVCKVDLFNTAGWSNFTQGVFATDKYYPELPTNITVKFLSTNVLQFQWAPPIYPNGNINIYYLYFRHMQPAYYIPPHCKISTFEPKNFETSRLEAEFSTLQPFSYYSVQIAAQNDYGTGDYTLPVLARTLPSVSDPLTYFMVTAINGPDVNSTTYKANVALKWLMPCKANGEIEEFLLEFIGKRSSTHSPVHFSRRVEPVFDGTGYMNFIETDLSPEYQYDVTISVRNKDVLKTSEAKLLTFDSPAGIPDKIEDISAAKVNPFDASNPTSSAVVRFSADLLNSEAGTIQYAALLLSQKNCNPEPKLLVGALDSSNEWPDSESWTDAYSNADCIKQYQTTPIRWQPIQPRSGNIIEYTVGAESCSNISKRYCNGPLKPDTEYQMVIRLFTKSSFSDAGVLEFKTDSLIKLALIWISIISCLFVAFIGGFLYLYITKKIIWHRESGHGIEDSFGDITSKNFAIFYNELSKRDKLQREFKELTVIATDLSFSASETNEYKNRYRDIFPYDKNRVILDIDADGNDYINASFINGYRRKKEYIATQGPKQESIVDFWRMVIQHNVKIIVMVTQFKEEDTVKCNHYYPYEWKNIKVEVTKEDSFDLYDRKEMLVTHAQQNIRHKIIHFYFKMWPDHGVPADPMSLITFVRKVKAEKCPSGSPIVVHCSAGVGRTGTFIGLDIIMQRVKSESKINIFETVKGLRFQRMKMVQSMQQYSFLYTCAFELVKHKRGKYVLKNKKKVSFENDQDTDLGTIPKVSIMDADSGKNYETKDLESVI